MLLDMRNYTINLARINAAVNAVRAGKVRVSRDEAARLHGIYETAFATEFFELGELQLIERIETQGNNTHGLRVQ